MIVQQLRDTPVIDCPDCRSLDAQMRRHQKHVIQLQLLNNCLIGLLVLSLFVNIWLFFRAPAWELHTVSRSPYPGDAYLFNTRTGEVWHDVEGQWHKLSAP